MSTSAIVTGLMGRGGGGIRGVEKIGPVHVHGKKSEAFDASLSAVLGGEEDQDAKAGLASAAATPDDEDIERAPKSRGKRAKDDAKEPAAPVMPPQLLAPPLPVHVLSVSLPPVEVNEVPARTTPAKIADLAKAAPVAGPATAQPRETETEADAAPLAEAPAAPLVDASTISMLPPAMNANAKSANGGVAPPRADTTKLSTNAGPNLNPTLEDAPAVAAAMVPEPPPAPSVEARARAPKAAPAAARPVTSAATRAASTPAVSAARDAAPKRAVAEVQAPPAPRPEDGNAERPAKGPAHATPPKEPQHPAGGTPSRGHRAAGGGAEASTAKVGAPVPVHGLVDPPTVAFAAPSAGAATVKDPSGVNATTVAEVGPRQAPETTANAVSAAEAVGHKRALADVAHGQIQVPELGRVEVSARARAGDAHVDVHVRADAVHAQEVIAANAPEMRAHLRVDVPNATVHVDRSAPRTDFSRSSSSSAGASRDGETTRERRREDRGEDRGRTEQERPSAARRGARVRFVL